MRINIYSRGKHFVVKVDVCDFEEINKMKWSVPPVGYPVCRKNGMHIYMHRFILKLQTGDGLVVDHINGDKLDNRRKNLRIVSKSQNAINRHGVVCGVNWCNKRLLWRARIGINKKDKHLGFFRTYNDALCARKKAEKKIFSNYHNGV